MYGVGDTTAVKILSNIGLDETKRTHALSEDELTQIRDELENYAVEGDLRRAMRLNIKRCVPAAGLCDLRRDPRLCPSRSLSCPLRSSEVPRHSLCLSRHTRSASKTTLVVCASVSPLWGLHRKHPAVVRKQATRGCGAAQGQILMCM